MENFLLFVILVALAISIWALHCNNETYKNILSMLDKISEHNMDIITKGNYKVDTAIFYDLLNEVPYNKHVWYLMTFRDPNKLYDKRLLDILI